MYIVATISKNSYPAEKIREIINAGATILRYNFSHGTPDEMYQKISIARDVIKELNQEGRVLIMADLPGAKIRLGKFQPSEFAVDKDQIITFRSGESSPNPEEYIPVDYPNIGKFIEIGKEISCADGELGFIITEIVDENTFKAKALNSRHIPTLKALNIGSAMDEIDHITDKTLEHLKNLSRINPELVAFSFVNSKEYLVRCKKLLNDFNPDLKAKIVSKLETENSLTNIKEILEESDYILVARGDLGLTVPIERLGIYQKIFTREARKAGKQVIVSTQILDSVVNQYTPQRAEILDLTNIVLDGADGIMLAKETGISLTPGQSILIAKKVIEYVEKSGL